MIANDVAHLNALGAAGQITSAAHRRARELLDDRAPTSRAWRDFLVLAFGVFGLALLLAGVIFFFAYNWEALGRFARFGLLQTALVACCGLAAWRGLHTLLGRLALAAGVVLIGPLLAVFGQIYQTGADPYQLFLGWAALAFLWVVVARTGAVWIIWLVVLDAGVVLYAKDAGGWPIERLLFNEAPLALLVQNTLALALWEWGSARSVAWLQSRWEPRAIATVTLAGLTMLALERIFEGNRGNGAEWVLPVYLLTLGALYGVYRYRRPDLYMLAIGCASAIAAIMSVLLHGLWRNIDVGVVLLLGLALVGLSAGAGIWLRSVGRVMKGTP